MSQQYVKLTIRVASKEEAEKAAEAMEDFYCELYEEHEIVSDLGRIEVYNADLTGKAKVYDIE